MTDLPTPRTILGSGSRLLVWCKSCRHQENFAPERLVDTGRGDVPLIELRFRCARCRSLTLTGW